MPFGSRRRKRKKEREKKKNSCDSIQALQMRRGIGGMRE